MKQFRHRGRLRERALLPITAAYVVAALLLGVRGAALGTPVLGHVTSPVSSASAIAILSAIASGMMALTAIVFSLAFIAIQISGASYTPRLARLLGRTSLMGHSLGLFIGTFVYALLAIRTVDVADRPGINITVLTTAGVWLLASVLALVMLIPRLRSLLIADVLALLYDVGAAAATRVYPATAPSRASLPDLPVTDVVHHEGRPQYVVGLDVRRLVRDAALADGIVVIVPAIGDAVIAGDRLAVVLGGRRAIPAARLRRAIWLAPERSVDNDPACAIRMLVDIAIRALSPAVNDPTTAVTVLDEIEGLLLLLGARHLEDDQVIDRGAVRVVRSVPSWDDIVALALTEIHQYGRDSIQVQRRLATLLRDLSDALPPHRRPAIDRFAHWRATSVSESFHAAQSWTDAFAYDRQGLGHESDVVALDLHRSSDGRRQS